MNELISVVMPIYNVEKYLEFSVSSVMKQTYVNIEIILVDDGSTDLSGKICDQLAQKDERIVVIHKENGGLSDARNVGIRQAKGNYISLIDSDDYVHPRFLELLYLTISEAQADIAVCDYEEVYEFKNDYKNFIFEDINVLSGLDCIYEMYKKCYVRYIVAWNKLYKKSLFDEIEYPFGKVFEDEATTYKLFYKALKVGFIDATLYYYMQREGSITAGKFNTRKLEAIPLLQERLSFYKRIQNEVLIKLELGHVVGIILEHYCAGKECNKLTSDMKKDIKNAMMDIIKENKQYMKLYQKCACYMFCVAPSLEEKIRRKILHC